MPRPKKPTDKVVREKRPRRQLPPWKHELSPVVLRRLHRLIPSQKGNYDLLCKIDAPQWGMLLTKYAEFQILRRKSDESEAAHRTRQADWLSRRRRWERKNREFSDDIQASWMPHVSGGGMFEIVLGTWVAQPKQIAGSELENMVTLSPTGRVMVFDIASDKDLLMMRFSELIDGERQAVGMPAVTRRGPNPAKKKQEALLWGKEQREFLRSIWEHRIVPLWDMQLAGSAAGKLETARALYPEMPEERSLLRKIGRAEELQQEALAWILRLRAAT